MPSRKPSVPNRRTPPATAAEGPRARRIFLAGALTIALLGGGALAILSREPGAAAAPRQSPAYDPTAPSDPAPPIAISPAPPPAPAPPIVARPPPPDPARVPGVIPRAAPHRLPRGSPAPVELFRGLAALQEEVGRCAPDVRPPSHGAAPGGQSVFMLDLETLDRRVRIVEAPVQARGAATDQVLACARGVLLGHEIPVQVARPGSRIQLPLAVKL